MIPKASQRGGGGQLATHLLNEYDNERVQVVEIRGAMAHDLHGAFGEWRAHARATKCQKYLYSLSINPDPDQGPLTRDQYLDFITRTEKQLGLEGQPRAVVFHVKHGREHCHTVWSRIDLDRMRAVQLSHDRPKLQTVVREFAREHGLQLPTGLRDRAAKRFNDRQKRENLQEKQQEERTGVTKAERMRQITGAWKDGPDARGFVVALEKQGYYLARGNRRAYVVIDRFGEIHSLARYIEGVRAPAVRERLNKEFPLERLPDAADAQHYARRKREAQMQFKRDFVRAAESQRAQLQESQRRRRLLLAQRKASLEARHRTEREALREAHEDINKGIAATRLIRRPRGIVALLARVTGIQALVDLRRRRRDRARAQEQARQMKALQRRHGIELMEIDRLSRALRSVEKRELRSLGTALRREHLLMLDRAATSAERQAEPEQQRGAAHMSPSEKALGEGGASPDGDGTTNALRRRADRNRRQREREQAEDERTRRDRDRDR